MQPPGCSSMNARCGGEPCDALLEQHIVRIKAGGTAIGFKSCVRVSKFFERESPIKEQARIRKTRIGYSTAERFLCSRQIALPLKTICRNPPAEMIRRLNAQSLIKKRARVRAV